MQPGIEVDWEDMKVGKPYIVVLRKNPRETFQEAPVKGRLLFKSDTMASFDTYATVDRDEVDRIYAPKKPTSEFARNLALVNTELEADPGVLRTIMSFEKPDFKPNPWKGMTKAQAAAAAAADTKRAEEEALAAMKTGGRKTRRRRRRTTRRRK